MTILIDNRSGAPIYEQIFTQIRYPRAANEEISRSLLALLASAGFMNNGQA